MILVVDYIIQGGMMDFGKLKDAVNSIEMSNTIKNRIVENSITIKKRKVIASDYRRWILVACVFAVILSGILGIPFINKNGDFHAITFAITAYAVGDDGNQFRQDLSEERSDFEISTEERVGLISSVRGDGANLIFTDVMLNIVGEEIKSITYTINKGKFVEDVTFTAEKYADKDWLLKEKIYTIYAEPGSNMYQGIKQIGKTYTVMYEEQDKYKYTIAIPHDGNYMIDDDIIININVTHSDGSTIEQAIIVESHDDAVSLRIK